MREGAPRRRALVVAGLCSAAVVAVAPAATAAGGLKGPDVSSWQHPDGKAINWGKVADAGSRFAIVKATEGASYANPYYPGDVAGARVAGLINGAYAFARPELPMSSATEQADHFADTIGDITVTGTLPAILDLESTGGLPPAKLITWTQWFLERLRARTGRTPMLYTYPAFLSASLAGTKAFARYPLWLAAYQDSTPPAPAGWDAWSLWQYTSSASVPGIPTGGVDMSRFAGSVAEFDLLADGSTATPWTVSAPSAPVGITAIPGSKAATARWLPADDGGERPSAFTVTATPGGRSVTVNGTASSATISGLRAGIAYTLTVTATNSAGTSPASRPSPAVTPGRPPPPPGTLAATAGDGSVTVTWAGPTGAWTADAYRVLRCSPAPCTPTVPAIATVNAPATSYIDPAAANGTSYSYAVIAANRWGSSAPSVAVEVTPGGAPDQPTSVTVTPVTGGFAVTWEPPADDGGRPITGYRRNLDGKSAGLATATSWSIRGLSPGSRHTLAIAAVNAAGRGTPAAVVATVLDPSRLRVAWSPHPALAGETVMVSITAEGADTHAAQPGRSVTVRFTPAAGPVPAPVTVTTDESGTAIVAVRPDVNGTLTVEAGATDLYADAATTRELRVLPPLPAHLSATSVPAGDRVIVRGRTNAAFAGERVYRQYFADGGWHRAASTVIDSTGRYRFVIHPTAGRSDTYRLRLPPAAAHLTGVSRVFRVTGT